VFQISQQNLKKIYNLRDTFVDEHFGLDMYNYQRGPSNHVIKSVLQNDGDEIPMEFSRQSGKTTAVVATITFLSIYIFALLKDMGLPVRKDASGKREWASIIFAPTQEQGKTDFDRFKDNLAVVQKPYKLKYSEYNRTTLKLSNGVKIYCFPLTLNSKPESKTADLIVLEEAQDIPDLMISKAAEPMGAATNATVLWVGTAGYKKCRFHNVIQRRDKEGLPIYIYDKDSIIAEKRARYLLTKNPFHLNYELFVEKRVKDLGEDSDHIRTQYLLIWVLEHGQYITDENLMNLMGTYDEIFYTTTKTWAFIDWAKQRDRTVVTVLDRRLRILSWLEMRGHNYVDQWEEAKDFLKGFPNLQRLGMDVTSTQDMQKDWVENDMAKEKNTGEWVAPTEVVGINFTDVQQDAMYRLLWRLMHDVTKKGKVLRSSRIRFPKTESPERERFLWEFSNLQKDIIKKKLWRVEAPKGNQYGDDYPDSLAGAAWISLNPDPQKKRSRGGMV